MKATSTFSVSVSAERLQREICRFMEAARERGEFDFERRRRAQRRYHRSWPLLMSFGDSHLGPDMCVALHNASPLGIAFLCSQHIPVDTTILIKLFWHDESGPFIPAVVRHSTRNHHGYIVGCAFAIEREGRDGCATNARRKEAGQPS